NVTAISPLFHLSPVASSDNDLGWAPSCTTPDCLPTASWSTSAINSTLSFQYWGKDVALDGSLEGNMSIRVLHNRMRTPWHPSGDTLFSFRGSPVDNYDLHNVTLEVLDAPPGAHLTITRARVNTSLLLDNHTPPIDRWTVPSNADGLKYTGFMQQASAAQSRTLSTHTSSTAGSSMSMWFNGSSLLVYGPCGPDNGLMGVTIDGRQQIVNTSKPFASSDCLLFQTWGLQWTHFHRLLIENMDGKKLGINRFELFRITTYPIPRTIDRGVAVGCGIASVFITCMMMIAVYVIKFVRRRQTMDVPEANRHWFQLLYS
ncbi:unnamed protein product, partial [Rhizoctonia solani]